ncbi:hypothetical protein [Streptomyces sp. NPDC056682]|uniref:hypothetical protein n=1 Tax=Streptomyces sp. NPDC056682 TaxID=3345909 RepID=UPI00369C7F7D
MSLGIYTKNFTHTAIAPSFSDDRDESFRNLCEGTPWNSLPRGAHANVHTLFNAIQFRRLVEELEAPPEHEQLPIIHKVLDAAQLAIRNSGSLLLVGD